MDKHLHTINVYNQHVSEYVSRFMGLDLYKDTFDYLLQLTPQQATVLELGCGPGNVIKYLKSKRTDLSILGIDLAPEMIKEAKHQNPGSDFALMDIRDAGAISRQFDLVIAAFSIPYVSYDDIPVVFQNFQLLTVQNGLLYLSFMQGERKRSGFEKTSFTGKNEIYIHYYQQDEIEAMIAEHHFTVEVSFAKDYPETDGSVTTDLIYIARKRA